ncbi:MAG: GNAT family N-acetyltransferase [Thermoplasmatales archaeon]|nr:GNAT family N-acetyltransferase [Candidatus Methanoperedenaceae archaeon]MCG2825934.1 GNAT family N-acetyltransferase [Thermoplasmatales archaeon]
MIKIEEASLKDIDRIIELWKGLIDHHLSMTSIFQMRSDAEVNIRKYVKDSIESKDGLVLIAKEQNRIIAYMLCKIVSNPPVLEERKFGAISDAFVLEDKRNKGIIKKMENKAVEWFKGKGMKSTEVRVYCKNEIGNKVWGKLGYKDFIFIRRKEI